MKKALLSILGCLLAVCSYSQNRYSTYSTSTFTPKSDTDIYHDMAIKNENLNKGIFDLINICDEQLDNTSFCYGEFRSDVLSIKDRLNNVNKRAVNGFISIYDVQNIYNSCIKDYNKSLKKHKREINKSFSQKKSKSKNKLNENDLYRFEKVKDDIYRFINLLNEKKNDKSICVGEYCRVVNYLIHKVNEISYNVPVNKGELETLIDSYNTYIDEYNLALRKHNELISNSY